MFKKNLPLIIGLSLGILASLAYFLITPISKSPKSTDSSSNNSSSYNQQNQSSSSLFSQNNSESKSSNQSSSNLSLNINNDLKTFTTVELTKFNGKNSELCYIGYKTKIYDINDSRLWDNGVHIPASSSVKCGQDNTQFMKNAPHGEEVLKKFKVVGNLK
jgi:predicted heme/steroid binding protein